ncbi:SET domain-containing protein [Paenibacillus methanolicus]|uniref:SET domain-containing protein n=1 Tax=Paenibacillus methanolicus TaxID=582686 RepID=A0A5S5C3F0_9BACL|nr:SET domain-containing protein [Paenibacillus methanolicus]TYP73955.1 hypothetical protein BCM02_106234 [Paenibacillus methanolicus]
MIEVRTSKIDDGEFNRGVFATEPIAKGTMFHAAPVIPYPNEQHEHIEKTLLADYMFSYGENHTALLLGYGMLFNHSYKPNAYYELNFDNHTVEFYAYGDIAADDEIYINYGGEVDSEDAIWFEDKNASE